MAVALGIDMREDGFVKVSELLSTESLPISYSRPWLETEKARKGPVLAGYTLEDIEEVVKNNAKKNDSS